MHPASVVFREVEHLSPQYTATVALRRRVLRAPLGLDFTDEQLAGEAGQIHWGGFEPSAASEVLVACLVMHGLGQGRVQIRQVAVAPECQGRGIGAALMASAEAWARQSGYCEVMLHARATVVGFYERLGYRAVEDEFVEIGLAHREMVKQL